MRAYSRHVEYVETYSCSQSILIVNFEGIMYTVIDCCASVIISVVCAL